jgi:hypothetical protein
MARVDSLAQCGECRRPEMCSQPTPGLSVALCGPSRSTGPPSRRVNVTHSLTEEGEWKLDYSAEVWLRC